MLSCQIYGSQSFDMCNILNSSSKFLFCFIFFSLALLVSCGKSSETETDAQLQAEETAAELEAAARAAEEKAARLEKLKVEKAKVETERVKQEALQTYERLAAVAKANGIDVQIKAAALRNPFVAQYEVAKALQNWNGEVTLPNTLAIMEQASNGGGGASIFPIVPITTK